MSVPLVAMLLRDSARTDWLRGQIRRRGGRAFCLPMFRFAPVHDCPPALALLREPHKYALLVFVSPNGADALHRVARRAGLPLPLRSACAAPGQGTRSSLQAKGFRSIVSGSGVSDLQTLLQSGQLGSIKNRQVAVIQRREASPKALQALRRLGALPTAVPCYERLPCAEDAWTKLSDELRGACNAVVAYDAPSLQLLLERVSADERAAFLARPLAVIHPAIRDKAIEMGFENIIVAGESEDLIGKMQQSVEKPAQ